jgi:hypothetical protein
MTLARIDSWQNTYCVSLLRVHTVCSCWVRCYMPMLHENKDDQEDEDEHKDKHLNENEHINEYEHINEN